MLEEDGDQLRHGLEDEDSTLTKQISRIYVLFLILLSLTLLLLCCLISCCFTFKKCVSSLNLRVMSASHNITPDVLRPLPNTNPVQQGSRTEAVSCSTVSQINQGFDASENQSQGNQVEQPNPVEETTQENMKNNNITKINESSFGNPPKTFPVYAVKYNGSSTLATIVELNPSRDSSQNSSEVTPEVPKTSCPPKDLQTRPFSTATNLTGNTSMLPAAVNSTSIQEPAHPIHYYSRYSKSVAVPSSSKIKPPPQTRFKVSPTPGQTESHENFSDSKLNGNTELCQRYLNSQNREALKNNYPLPPQSTSVLIPRSSELPGNIQTPKIEQQKEELIENSPTVGRVSQMLNDSHDINEEPEISHGTCDTSVDSYEFSTPSSSKFVRGDSALYRWSTSHCIAPIDINKTNSDSIEHSHRYCPHCHLRMHNCECGPSEKNNENPGTPTNE